VSTKVHTWRIELLGEQFDLDDLPLWLAGCDVGVRRDDKTYWLELPAEALGLASPESVVPYASNVLDQLNAVGHLLNPSFRPIKLSDKTFGLDATGTLVSTSMQVSGAEMRVKAGLLAMSVNGVPQPDPRIGLAKPLLLAAIHSTRAQDALAILSRQNLTWSELYLLFELVEGDVGGLMYAQGWLDRSTAKLFTRTANSYSALRSAVQSRLTDRAERISYLRSQGRPGFGEAQARAVDRPVVGTAGTVAVAWQPVG